MGEARRSCGQQFPVDSVVEVVEKEAGVRLVCTVIPPPRNIEPEENEGQLYVRYRALPARRGGRRLREFVDLSSVRPTPPPHKATKRFEPNDVVEAYHNGCWWEGVVTAVELDGGGEERLVVTLENPLEPGELRFAPSSLRPLWDWVDGVWSLPQRKGELKVGEKVEVSIDLDFDLDFDFNFDFRVAWFPAVIVRDLGKGVYSVELKGKNVECVGIRPSPPILDEGEFRVGEKVDAFFDSGWWTGFVVKKVGMNEYIVLFEHPDSTMNLNRSQLRPHLEWKDGKWLVDHDGAASSAPNVKRKRKSSFSASKRHNRKLIDGDCVSRAPNEETEHIDVEYDRDVQQLIDSRAPTEHVDVKYDRGVQQLIDVDSVSKAPNEETKHIDVQQLIDEDDSVSRAPNENSVLFVKRNAIWKSTEWAEVLRRMPHFEPLRAFRENQREGLAIACMVTFTNVVEESRRLKLTDPKSEAEDLLETLLDLEMYGFDVGAVRERVRKLLKAKEEEERLEVEAKGILEQIEVRSGRRERIGRQMREMNAHIGRLQDWLMLAEVVEEKEVEEIRRLQVRLEKNQKQVESLRSDFEASLSNGD
ncbi:DUF724 domain-containing protein 9-like [Salvia hispanica]|uniref:DUF724 domain-containing protein 9-like n=1 Tax=Salvia hispanica TaxID=49212 RepID=UPI00200914C2|nr:DUF724 domain-containing protein 9-like [Salvia hispanica]